MMEVARELWIENLQKQPFLLNSPFSDENFDLCTLGTLGLPVLSFLF